jgi:hypothetical protein
MVLARSIGLSTFLCGIGGAIALSGIDGQLALVAAWALMALGVAVFLLGLLATSWLADGSGATAQASEPPISGSETPAKVA